MYGLAENPIVHYYLVYYQFFVLYVLLSLNPLVHYYVFFSIILDFTSYCFLNLFALVRFYRLSLSWS